MELAIVQLKFQEKVGLIYFVSILRSEFVPDGGENQENDLQVKHTSRLLRRVLPCRSENQTVQQVLYGVEEFISRRDMELNDDAPVITAFDSQRICAMCKLEANQETASR